MENLLLIIAPVLSIIALSIQITLLFKKFKAERHLVNLIKNESQLRKSYGTGVETELMIKIINKHIKELNKNEGKIIKQSLETHGREDQKKYTDRIHRMVQNERELTTA